MSESINNRRAFEQVRLAERQYARQLRQIARYVGDLTRAIPALTLEGSTRLQDALRAYAKTLGPWAEAVSARMLADINRRDLQAWERYTRRMGRGLQQEIKNAPTGDMMRALLAEQVTLITSLPLEAAQRVHKLTVEGIAEGMRRDELAADIMRTGEVTKSRANLIARTEIARTASALTMARSRYVGSEGYIWRTARDSDVRKSHRQMEGKFVLWSEPPTLSDGTVTHAGMIYNCRCYSEPILPERFD